MPTITPFVYPTLFNVRVEVNWSDVTQATHATVWRVDCATGERSQLRPYVSYNDDGYLALSCGQAIFWDTEAPLDTCFYYCTTAQDAAGNETTTAVSPVVFDNFNRVNVDTWNNATSGQTWVLSAAAADYDVNGSRGTHAQPSIAVRNSQITVTGNLTEAYVETGVSQLATGDTLFNALALGLDGNNLYMARMQFRTDGTARLELLKRVAAVQTTLVAAVTIGPYVANTMYSIKLEVYPGSVVRAKSWLATDPEPEAWTVSATDSSLLTTPALILRSQGGAANTNVGLLYLWDNASAGDVCATTEVIEACSEQITLDSGDTTFMLRDPLNPCHDRQVGICWTPDPNCVPGEGIFFARMESEQYPGRGTALQPVNSRRPVPVVRQRGDAESTLVLVTRDFASRDAVLELNEPGTPLLWQAPPGYGIPDRYMAVGTVGVDRYNVDHRFQPRVMSLPFVTVDRPEGPSNGVCGARVDDLCDTFDTWDEIIAAGLTWADLLRGAASGDIPDIGTRNWNDVNATYASWNAVQAGNVDWDDVLDGP